MDRVLTNPFSNMITNRPVILSILKFVSSPLSEKGTTWHTIWSRSGRKMRDATNHPWWQSTRLWSNDYNHSGRKHVAEPSNPSCKVKHAVTATKPASLAPHKICTRFHIHSMPTHIYNYIPHTPLCTSPHTCVADWKKYVQQRKSIILNNRHRDNGESNEFWFL